MKLLGPKIAVPTFMRPSSLLLLGLLPGCAWFTANSAVTSEYSRQVSVAAMRSAELEGQFALAEQRIAQLEETVRLQGQNQAEKLENIDQVNTEIGSLRGQLEEMKFKLQEMQDSLGTDEIEKERRQLHVERRVKQVEDFLKIRPPPPPTNEELGLEPGVGTPGDATPQAPATPEEALDLAADHMAAGRQGVARALLERVITDHPGAAELAEVRYRIGETWFNEGQFKRAVGAFQAVVDNHSTSDWAAWAMYRQGESFSSLDEPSKARLFWDELISKYPKSGAAKEAKSKHPK